MVRTRSPAIAAAVASLTLVGSCASATTPPEPGHAVVVEVLDGDTVVVDLGDQTEEVRLIGVDTPETHHPTRPVECYGAEATARTEELLPSGSTIRLERDQEPRDRYGRLLAYVHRDDGLFVNLALVEEGYADALRYPPNETYSGALATAAATARAEGRGMWGACGGPDTPVG